MRFPSLHHEQKLWRQGLRSVAGVDEAGRGALAGPVVAAAVVFAPGSMPKALRDVRDSKILSALQRERLYALIQAHAVTWSVGIAQRNIIDRINIANASMLAMQKAIAKLYRTPEHLLLDGIVPRAHHSSFLIPYSSCIKGDSRIFSIAAASIIAKVTRDRLMQKLHKIYSRYGFHQHKGYGTELHYRMLKKYGPCAAHRRSFFLG